MKTDSFTRSFDGGRHPPYDALVTQVMNAIADPTQALRRAERSLDARR
jgi:hypothetical protein